MLFVLILSFNLYKERFGITFLGWWREVTGGFSTYLCVSKGTAPPGGTDAFLVGTASPLSWFCFNKRLHIEPKPILL